MIHLRKSTTLQYETVCVGINALFFGAQVHARNQNTKK